MQSISKSLVVLILLTHMRPSFGQTDLSQSSLRKVRIPLYVHQTQTSFNAPPGSRVRGGISNIHYDVEDPEDQKRPAYDITILVNKRRVTAIFDPHSKGSRCGRQLMDKLGINLPERPFAYSDFYFPYFPTMSFAEIPRSGPHLVHQVDTRWAMPVDIEIMGVKRAAVPIVVIDKGGATMIEHSYEFGPYGFVLGSDFFEPGKFNVVDNNVIYEGPLVADGAKSLIGFDGKAFSPHMLTENEINNIKAQSEARLNEVWKATPEKDGLRDKPEK